MHLLITQLLGVKGLSIFKRVRAHCEVERRVGNELFRARVCRETRASIGQSRAERGGVGSERAQRLTLGPLDFRGVDRLPSLLRWCGSCVGICAIPRANRLGLGPDQLDFVLDRLLELCN